MSMVEKFLAEVYQKVRNNRVAIFIDGESLSNEFVEILPILRDKVKELGEIRLAEVYYVNSVPKRDFELLRQAGFTDTIVPANIELSFLLEVYDNVLEEKADFLILGTQRDELIPLFAEIRKSVTVFALVDNKSKVSQAFLEAFDGIIEVNKIDEFVFNELQFSEIDQLIQQSVISESNGQAESENNGTSELISDYTGPYTNVVDESNIGTFSEDALEDEEMLEEMKKEYKTSES